MQGKENSFKGEFDREQLPLQAALLWIVNVLFCLM